jgi:hypothetical protein
LDLEISSKVRRVGKQWQLLVDGNWKPQDAIAVGRAIAEPIRELLSYANDAIFNDEEPFKSFRKENLAAFSRLGKNGFLTGVLANLGSLESISMTEGAKV